VKHPLGEPLGRDLRRKERPAPQQRERILSSKREKLLKGPPKRKGVKNESPGVRGENMGASGDQPTKIFAGEWGGNPPGNTRAGEKCGAPL